MIERDARIVGREHELAALRAFLSGAAPVRALVLSGDPGIGKTTLWEAGVAAAREQGCRVLAARPSGAEAELSFAALFDLCEDFDAAALAALPAPQRAALEVALLRAEPVGAPPAPQAIALGLLNGLRALAAREPLLIAIDDLQWLDPPSADALAFAARRLEREPVGFLLATRPGPASVLEQALARSGPARLAVRPLGLGATRRLLSDRLGLSLSRPLLRRIAASTVGNPLFALELGRTLVERGPPGPGEDLLVPDAVEDVLGTRVSRLPDTARRLLLAVALSAELRTAELAAVASAAAVEDAVAAGVLRVDGDRVRAAHPLLAAAARQRARPSERLALHRDLAGAVADAELRALHLALATERPDAGLAATVAAAAARASSRGARQEAVQLAEHALRLTPPGAAERGERVLALAAYLETGGALQRLTDLLSAELDALPPGRARARAWLHLCEGAGVKSLDDLERHLARALDEAGDDPELRAHVLAVQSCHRSAVSVAGISAAEATALEALAAAPVAGPEVERLALDALAWARCLRGRPIDDLCARFRAVSEDAPNFAYSPERVAGQRLVWRGELREARAVGTRFLTLADERGEPVAYALQRLHLCELELRAGEWDAAARLLDEWAESSDGDLLLPPMYERCRALLAAGRGLPDEAERWAASAVASGAATGVRWDELEALRARGIAALAAHDPARAAAGLRTVWEHTQREGIDDPGTFPVAPDLVEALAQLGEAGEAQAVTDRLRALAEAQEHPWGLAAAQRCAALTRIAARRNDEEAAAGLAGAAAEFERLGLRFDAARSLLSLGRAQRRRRQWRTAGDALDRAVAAFDAIGSTGWAAQGRSERARVGGRRPRAPGELTPAEQRAAELAATGLSNKEIAQTLFVTVRTVEVHLSSAYAKLGVRSRTQLAARLAAVEETA